MKKKLWKKEWLDRRCVKLQNKKRKKSGKRYSPPTAIAEKEIRNIHYAKAPEIFSFIKNTEMTNKYFLDIIEQIKKGVYKQIFFIDSSDVKEVTIDALVYVLALLYNLKLSPQYKYGFKGNIPNEMSARRLYMESGFMNYVKTKRAVMPQVDDRVQILTGKNTDTNVAVKICDFVNLRFGKCYKFTIDLYKALIELMSNTVHHAYHDNSPMVPHWFLYAIDRGDCVQFTFIDTGEGIPNTVKRKIFEKGPFALSDSELIYSAFLGEKRTETGMYNRGHGLPALYEMVMNGKLSNFHVLSGSGCCQTKEVNGKIIFEKIEYGQEIIGTIFQFEILNLKEDAA